VVVSALRLTSRTKVHTSSSCSPTGCWWSWCSSCSTERCSSSGRVKCPRPVGARRWKRRRWDISSPPSLPRSPGLPVLPTARSIGRRGGAPVGSHTTCWSCWRGGTSMWGSVQSRCQFRQQRLDRSFGRRHGGGAPVGSHATYCSCWRSGTSMCCSGACCCQCRMYSALEVRRAGKRIYKRRRRMLIECDDDSRRERLGLCHSCAPYTRKDSNPEIWLLFGPISHRNRAGCCIALNWLFEFISQIIYCSNSIQPVPKIIMVDQCRIVVRYVLVCRCIRVTRERYCSMALARRRESSESKPERALCR
jgi:hypothetical protein